MCLFLECVFWLTGTVYIVVEYAPYGNLRQYLRNNRPSVTELFGENGSSPVTLANLASFALQIAKGMEFLASHQVQLTILFIFLSFILFYYSLFLYSSLNICFNSMAIPYIFDKSVFTIYLLLSYRILFHLVYSQRFGSEKCFGWR